MGCGIAAAAAVAGVSYGQAKRTAASMGIHAADPRLWSDTAYVRRLLRRLGSQPVSRTRRFSAWRSLPPLALLAIKWRREGRRAFWHWVVFVREGDREYVLDSKQSLKAHRRTDFGRMRPKWFLPLLIPARLSRDVQKGRWSHPPNPGAPRRAVPRAAAAQRRGGTYQASLEPLASITCERIGPLPPVFPSGRAFERRENAAGGLFQHPASGRRRLSSGCPPAAGEIPDTRGGVRPVRALRTVGRPPFPAS